MSTMVTGRELERLYCDRRAAVRDLVGEAGPEVAASTPVPACPLSTVHDVVAHLPGLCADVLAGNIGGAATDDWTAAQVAARAARSTTEVLAEWDELVGPFAAMLDDFPGWYGTQVLADLTAHEHDLRAALGRPGDRDTEAVTRCLDYALSVRVHAVAAAGGLGPVRFDAGHRSWTVGASEPSGETADALIENLSLSGERRIVTEPPQVTVTASPFELARAVTGRRSERQIRALDWSADPSPFLRLFSAPPFTTAGDDIVE